MKKYIKVLIILLAIAISVFVFVGYNIYNMITRSEEISGVHVDIPIEKSDSLMIEAENFDWPNWRGLNFDGKSELENINTDWTNGLTKLWEVNFLCQDKSTASWSAPSIKGNHLIIPGRDDKNDLLFCINTDSGNLIWNQSYEAKAETTHGPGPRATPFIDDNKVYTYGRSGDLVCWQLSDGKMIWRKNVKNEGGFEPGHGYASSPLVIDNKVIVQAGGDALIIAYNKLNGEVEWKSMKGMAGYASIVPVFIDSDTLLLAFHGTGLSCLNLENGNEYWTTLWETPHTVNATTPTFENNMVFISSGYGMGGAALKISKEKYEIIWKNLAIAAHHTDPIIIDGFIYGYSGQSIRNKGQFKCIELETGNEMWSTDEMGWGTTIFVDEHLICLDVKGNLYLVKADSNKFIKVGGFPNALENIKNLAWTSPVVANGKLYLRYLQTLVCYDFMP